jgi:hypothetical protein
MYYVYVYVLDDDVRRLVAQLMRVTTVLARGSVKLWPANVYQTTLLAPCINLERFG